MQYKESQFDGSEPGPWGPKASLDTMPMRGQATAVRSKLFEPLSMNPTASQAIWGDFLCCPLSFN
jgi:hypothetical protein